MYLEIGNTVRIDKEMGGVKPYGINYAEDARFDDPDSVQNFYGDTVNGQQVFPDFMVISTNKTLEFCEIELIQMHNLTNVFEYAAKYGCMNPDAWNYNTDAEVDDGSCLLPPVDGWGHNTAWANLFLVNEFYYTCTMLIHPSNEAYYYNYPDSGHGVFDDPALDYGDDLVAEEIPVDGDPNRYDLLNNAHVDAAKAWFQAGWVPETNAMPNIPKFLHPYHCYSGDIKETTIKLMTFKFFGIDYGKYGDTSPSPLPPGMNYPLYATPESGTWRPVYNQYITSQYSPSGAPHSWNDFYYIPFPAWQDEENDTGLTFHSGGAYSIINDALNDIWNFQGGIGNDSANLVLNIKNIICENVAYDADGSVLNDPSTFPMTEMTIDVLPTAYRYNSPHQQYEGGPYTDPMLEEFEIRAHYPIVINGVPNFNNEYDLSISRQPVYAGMGILHAQLPDNGIDTIFRHDYEIWTIYLKVTIKNEFTTESEVTIRLRFGWTGWGGPVSDTPYGWGE
tara:strand:- start:69 stop:1583 length:1515 start_codon:yes stop_codon:yes gene_type:complete